MSEGRLGVLGGTFDPIHYGHLRIAEEALFHFRLDRVLFIPAGLPPHKIAGTRATGRDRLMMALLATASHDRFDVSTIELDRGGMSYTVDTLRDLRAAMGQDTTLYFILGADAVLEMHTWKDPEGVLKLCRLAVSTRPGFDLDLLAKVPVSGLVDHVELFPVPATDLSSTEIRRRAAAGRGLRFLVPESVEGYIRKRGLYREETAAKRERE